MKKYGKEKAFTLMELLVVIVILAILGSVAFITLNQNIEMTKNSSKVTALDNIKSTLVSYRVTKGLYPDPTNNVDITYSGATVWKQGTFGKDVIEEVKGNKENFVDSITKNEYSYSVTSDGKEFQIAGVLSTKTSYIDSIIPSSYAVSKKAGIAILLGDYNGNILDVNIGGVVNILAIPSIMASDVSSTKLIDILNNNSLVYNGSSNLPASYKNSEFNVNGGVSLKASNLVIFSGSLVSLKNERNRLKLLLKMKRSYNGTKVNSIRTTYLKDINIDLIHPSSKSLDLACDVVNNELNYKVKCNNDSFFAIPLTNFTNTNFKGLVSPKVNTAFIDNAGAAWFGTKKGLSVYSSGTWIQFNNTNGLASNNVTNIIQLSNNNIWVSTTKGISIYSSGTWSQVNNTNGLISNTIKKITQASNNNVWVSTDKGVSVFNGTTWTSYSNELTSKDVTGLIEASNNDIWIATDEGISVFNGSSWSKYDTELSSSNIITMIKTSNNDIWVSTDEGVNVFDGTTWKSYKDELNDKNVNYIFQSNDNRIWVATDKGISVFDGSSWVKYSIIDGLISNAVMNIFQESNGTMWFVTRKGLSKLVSGVFTNYLNGATSQNNNNEQDGFHSLNEGGDITIIGIENKDD